MNEVPVPQIADAKVAPQKVRVRDRFLAAIETFAALPGRNELPALLSAEVRRHRDEENIPDPRPSGFNRALVPRWAYSLVKAFQTGKPVYYVKHPYANSQNNPPENTQQDETVDQS